MKHSLIFALILSIGLISVIPLILSIGIAPVLPFADVIPKADALKSKGNSLTETGSNKVCGDRLCSELEATELSSDKIKQITEKAFIYVYPMLENYKTMYNAAVDESSELYVTPFNVLHHNEGLSASGFSDMIMICIGKYFNDPIFRIKFLIGLLFNIS